MNNSEGSKYPMLESILNIKNLALQPTYSTRDIAQIFGASIRAIQNCIASGRLIPRDLPGRGKFLSQDLEAFLKSSQLARLNPDAMPTR